MADFEAVLDVTPRSSLSLRLTGGVAHGLAGVAVAPLVLAGPVWAIAPAVLLCSAWHCDRRVRRHGGCHHFQCQGRGRSLRERALRGGAQLGRALGASGDAAGRRSSVPPYRALARCAGRADPPPAARALPRRSALG